MSFIQKLKLKGKFQDKQDKLHEQYERQQIQNLLKDEEKDIFKQSIDKIPKQIEQPPIQGKGRILTSGRTVHGKDTFFTQQVEQGDKIIVFNQSTLGKDEVSVVLSDKSLQLKEPFSQDLISYSVYEIQKKPKQVDMEQTLEDEFTQKIDKLKKGIQKHTQYIDTRIKKPGMWGYQTIKEKVKDNLTKEQLLDLRSKKSSDRFCWI